MHEGVAVPNILYPIVPAYSGNSTRLSTVLAAYKLLNGKASEQFDSMLINSPTNELHLAQVAGYTARGGYDNVVSGYHDQPGNSRLALLASQNKRLPLSAGISIFSDDVGRDVRMIIAGGAQTLLGKIKKIAKTLSDGRIRIGYNENGKSTVEYNLTVLAPPLLKELLMLVFSRELTDIPPSRITLLDPISALGNPNLDSSSSITFDESSPWKLITTRGITSDSLRHTLLNLSRKCYPHGVNLTERALSMIP